MAHADVSVLRADLTQSRIGEAGRGAERLPSTLRRGHGGVPAVLDDIGANAWMPPPRAPREA